MMEKNAKIYVAGHRGMVGSAIVRELKRQGYLAGSYAGSDRLFCSKISAYLCGCDDHGIA